MRYIDTSTRNPSHTLAEWFKNSSKEGVKEIRMQTGYFSGKSMDLLLHAVSAEILASCTAKILIGSNDPRTQVVDVLKLIKTLNIPRSNAQVGIICFSDGLFHPKTYHLRRGDGSQTAYVGSANLTPSGLHKNVEAGIILDTNEGDDEAILEQIGRAIDEWFFRGHDLGIRIVEDSEFLKRLVELEILSDLPPIKKSSSTSGKGAGTALPGLKGLTSWRTSAESDRDEKEVVSSIATAELGSVLIAEITKGRLGAGARQIDINKSIAEEYFGGTGTKIRCTSVSFKGELGLTEDRIVGTKSSSNWYIELSGLRGELDSAFDKRPLLLMVQTQEKLREYQFHWLEPTDPNFGLVYRHFINEKGGTRGNKSIKVITSYSEFSSVWSNNPFELAGTTKGRT